MNNSKRQRSENWLEDDKFLLKELVKERVSVLENKNTDTNTNTKKVAAWADLQKSFNILSKGGPRTIAQLKSQWGTLKSIVKKKKAAERRDMIMTGGGPSAPIEPPQADDISVWLPAEFSVDTNEFDSDTIGQVSQAVHVVTDLTSPIPIELSSIHPPTHPTNDQGGIDDEVEEEAEKEDQPQSPKISFRRPKKTAIRKKKSANPTGGPAAEVAKCEQDCRRELHAKQMENEEIKKQNLLIQQQIFQKKLDTSHEKFKFYANQNKKVDN